MLIFYRALHMYSTIFEVTVLQLAVAINELNIVSVQKVYCSSYLSVGPSITAMSSIRSIEASFLLQRLSSAVSLCGCKEI